MVDFIEHYMGCSRQAASMAVKMWRHNLMHTSEPRMLQDPEQGKSLSWLLHWGEELPKADHFTVTGKTAMQINMALFHLIEDLKTGQRKYLKDLAGSIELLEKFHQAHREITETKLKVY